MADGKAFSYYDGKTHTILWQQPMDGSPPRQLTQLTGEGQIGAYAWSRDGKRLAMSRGIPSSDIVLFKGLKGK
jgi:Tol biopolymer transport system component